MRMFRTLDSGHPLTGMPEPSRILDIAEDPESLLIASITFWGVVVKIYAIYASAESLIFWRPLPKHYSTELESQAAVAIAVGWPFGRSVDPNLICK